jgi:nicotinate-nucleotide adenylyltransferase
MPRRRTTGKMRIGVFGGTFSPIHNGHLVCAEGMRQAGNLDSIEFAVSATPPNKPFGVLDAEDRYEMTVAATEDHPYFSASRVDLDHGGSGYSVLTVQAIKRQYKNAKLFFLSSAEYLDPNHKWWLPKWVGGPELFKLCTLMIFPRNTQEMDQLHAWRALVPQIDIEIADAPSPALSSTLIRDLVVGGKSLWYTTPWPVQQIIYKKGHYQNADTPMPNRTPVPANQIKRAALFCSQFDPLHFGHLLFAEWVRQEHNEDRVFFVPIANPPWNPSAFATAEARYRQCVIGTAENPFFDVSRCDMVRNTGSYALLAVEDMNRKLGPHVELDYIISSDYLKPGDLHITKWLGWDELKNKVRFLARPEDMTKVDEVKRLAAGVTDARMEVVYAPTLPINSADMRERVRKGRSLQYMTPYGVQQSILKSGIYR